MSTFAEQLTSSLRWPELLTLLKANLVASIDL